MEIDEGIYLTSMRTFPPYKFANLLPHFSLDLTLTAESYYGYLTALQLAKIATYGGKMLEKQDEAVKEVRATREELSF